ncbi:unnamed protein product [Cunninghamella blakesleeana]
MEETDKSITNDTNILSTATLSYRVKFYKLDDEGNWEDMGTGVCGYMENSGSNPDRIEVQSDSDSSMLVTIAIQQEKNLNRQDDTLLIWREHNDEEHALSFLEGDALNEIWRKICEKLDGHVTNESTDEYSPGEHDDDDDDSVYQEQRLLPQPNLSNLSLIATTVINLNTIQEKDQLISFILSDCYISKLFPIFHSCEDLELTESLHHLYTIMKTIILLGDNTIIEQIVEDDNIMNVAGILEYDPKTPDLKANHREVLKKQSEIETVVPVDDVITVLKIYETLRLQYLQNVICAEYLDRKASDVFHSLITCNHVDIIDSMQHNTKFLTDLFNLIKNEHSTDIDKTKGVQCVLQLCSISKSIPDESRATLFSILAVHGLFDIFEIALFSEDENIRVTGVNVLNSIVELNAPLVRRYILSQAHDNNDGNRNLLDCILDRFTTAADELLKLLYLDIIILILTPNGVQTNTYTRRNAEMSLSEDPQIDDILTLFYDNYIHYIMRPLQLLEDKSMKLTGPVETLELGSEHLRLYSDITQFICFAIRYHGYRSKYFILSSDCISKLVQLYRSESNSMKLDTLRVFRTCVGQLDDFYNRSLIKHNIFEPTIRVLLDTNRQYNALNSACIELFEFIHMSNLKALLTHVVEYFGTVLDTQSYVKTFKSLREKYEKNREMSDQPFSSIETDISVNSELNNTDTNNTPTIDKDEEDYFNTSDDSGNEEEEEEQKLGQDSNDDIELISKEDNENEEENTDHHHNDNSNGENDDTMSVAPMEKEKETTTLLPLKHRLRSDDEDDDEDDEIGKKLAKKLKSQNEEPKFLKRTCKLKNDDDDDDDDDMLVKKQKAANT